MFIKILISGQEKWLSEEHLCNRGTGFPEPLERLSGYGSSSVIPTIKRQRQQIPPAGYLEKLNPYVLESVKDPASIDDKDIIPRKHPMSDSGFHIHVHTALPNMHPHVYKQTYTGNTHAHVRKMDGALIVCVNGDIPYACTQQ